MSTRAAESEKESVDFIDFFDIWRVISYYKFYLLAFVAFIGLVAIYVVSHITPTYIATATLLLEDQNKNSSAIKSALFKKTFKK